MQPFDLVIRGGTVATATDSIKADVGIRGETIAAIGRGLDKGKQEIDARGKFVLPGGVDSHGHIEQLSASGLMNADTFESATTAAALGGTTTVISFAAQHVGMSLKTVVDDYHRVAERGAVIDYAFHMIIADPREPVLDEGAAAAGQGRPLLAQGIHDLRPAEGRRRAAAQRAAAARDNRAMVCVHAENHGMIAWMGKRLLKHGYTAPKYHAHLASARRRAGGVHAADRVRGAGRSADHDLSRLDRRGRGRDPPGSRRGPEDIRRDLSAISVQTKAELDRPGSRARNGCAGRRSREACDQEALWQALALGDLQVISSDHAPYAFDETGKLMAGKNANFKQIPNGMPGYEARLPLVFNEMVSNGRFDVTSFVAWTSTKPAKIYGLYPRKGTIAIGSDADIAIWDPKKNVTFSDKTVKDRSGYTPWNGRTVKGWPTTVLLRGEVLVDDGKLRAKPGSGQFLARKAGAAAEPLGRADAGVRSEAEFRREAAVESRAP